MSETVLVLDFGSQYTQLIARRVRELSVYSEIKPFNTPIDEIRKISPNSIILSGGPSSVWDKDSPTIDKAILELDIPVLGICYGMQLIVHLLGGQVERSEKREFGPSIVKIKERTEFFHDIPDQTEVWMSHSDKVLKVPKGFSITADTENAPVASIKNSDRGIYATQFHPEVVHTVFGREMLANFIFRISKAVGNWSAESFVEKTIESTREKVGNSNVVCALSGGVDSTVTAVLLKQAIGGKLKCIFVDTGMLRLNEGNEVEQMFKDLDLNLVRVNAEKTFLKKLKGVTDPEQKRRIIGEEFINIFEKEASKIEDVVFLAQGTLYPDVIESVSIKGPSATIKSHHNVGGLPEKMKLKLIEPLRELFKDEVREVGNAIGIRDSMLKRHPFPGPD